MNKTTQMTAHKRLQQHFQKIHFSRTPRLPTCLPFVTLLTGEATSGRLCGQTMKKLVFPSSYKSGLFIADSCQQKQHKPWSPSFEKARPLVSFFCGVTLFTVGCVWREVMALGMWVVSWTREKSLGYSWLGLERGITDQLRYFLRAAEMNPLLASVE